MKFLVLVSIAVWGLAAYAQQPSTTTTEKPKTETTEEVQKPTNPSTDVKPEEVKQ